MRKPDATGTATPVAQYLMKQVLITNVHVSGTANKTTETIQGEYAGDPVRVLRTEPRRIDGARLRGRMESGEEHVCTRHRRLTHVQAASPPPLTRSPEGAAVGGRCPAGRGGRVFYDRSCEILRCYVVFQAWATRGLCRPQCGRPVIRARMRSSTSWRARSRSGRSVASSVTSVDNDQPLPDDVPPSLAEWLERTAEVPAWADQRSARAWVHRRGRTRPAGVRGPGHGVARLLLRGLPRCQGADLQPAPRSRRRPPRRRDRPVRPVGDGSWIAPPRRSRYPEDPEGPPAPRRDPPAASPRADAGAAKRTGFRCVRRTWPGR